MKNKPWKKTEEDGVTTYVLLEEYESSKPLFEIIEGDNGIPISVNFLEENLNDD